MKRRGFTLIELMVVIAIIIILAAIAIPNYLSMTERAKKSRVASDFAAIATALESYKTDWGVYPTGTADTLTAASTTGSTAYVQLTGGATAVVDAAHPNYKVTGYTDAAGDSGGIAYMTTSILSSMKNPYTNALDYKYSSDGIDWVLFAPSTSTGTVGYSRSDKTVTLTGPSATLTVGQ